MLLLLQATRCIDTVLKPHLRVQSWQTVRPRPGVQGPPSTPPRQGRPQSSFNPYAGPFFPAGLILDHAESHVPHYAWLGTDCH